MVLGSGLIPPEQKEKFIGRPVFNRVTWPFDQSTIFYNDPTRRITKNEIPGGFGIGTVDEWYLEGIANIIKIIADKLFVYKHKDSYKNVIPQLSKYFDC